MAVVWHRVPKFSDVFHVWSEYSYFGKSKKVSVGFKMLSKMFLTIFLSMCADLDTIKEYGVPAALRIIKLTFA